MADAETWRPLSGGPVALTDHQLSQIGLLAVYEASAKSTAAASLRALKMLSFEEWAKLEKVQFSQIVEKLFDASANLDGELTNRLNALKAAMIAGQEMRHAILHASWGQAGAEDFAVAYDYSRNTQLDADYIGKALEKCAELKRASHWATFRVAELVERGIIPERLDGPGMSIRTTTRSVRL
jgi:hypothetical protein